MRLSDWRVGVIIQKRIKLEVKKINTFQEVDGYDCIVFRDRKGNVYNWYTRSKSDIFFYLDDKWFNISANIVGVTEMFIQIKNN